MAGGAPFQLDIAGTDYFAAFAGGSATTPYVLPDSISLSEDADGGGSTFSFEVIQEVTPVAGPWYTTIPDNALVTFVDTTLASNTTLFRGFVGNVEARLNGGGQGTIASVTALASTSVLDRIAVWKGKGTLSGVKNAVTSTIKIKRNQTDKVIIEKILSSYVNPVLGSGVSDLFDPTITSSITSTATLNPTVDDGDIDIPLGTLRAALDTIVELAQARDGKLRRYYLDPGTKALVYGFANAADATVTYATAPFKIITSGIDAPEGGTATPSTLLVREMSAGYDHEAARKRVFVLAADSNADRDTDPDPYVRTYTGVGFTSRSGIVFDSIVSAPTVRGSFRATKLTNAAKAFFAARRAPVRTITFTVRGAGTATGQTYGYAGGTVQAGSASYAYVDRWSPGMFVDITAAGMGLSGLYRVEQVTMEFEEGSLIRKWNITVEKRPRGSLSQYILGRR